MNLQRQLKGANFWTAAGLLPFAVMLCWSIAALATAGPNWPPNIPILDPFAMIGLDLMSFLFMLAVAGPQVWRAWRLPSDYVDLQSKTALVLPITALMLFLTPFMLSLYFSASRR
jgi:hypothetical protein